MSEWNTTTVGALYEVHNGLSKEKKFFGSGYPFISFKDVFNNFFLPQEIVGAVKSTEKERESFSVKRGDVLITRTSETYDELGMSAVALIDYPNATYNGFCKRLRPVNNTVHPEFIGYYMRSPEFHNGFQQFSSMTTRASLKNENLLQMELHLPKLEEQIRIADILLAYDELIENNRKQIKLLEEAAQRLYKEWFIDLKFPGYETTPIDPKTNLPEGWKMGSLADIVEFRRGKIITATQTKPGSIPVVAGGLEPAYFHSAGNTKPPIITVSGSGANAGFTRLYTQEIWVSDCSYVDASMTDCLYYIYESVINIGRGFRHLQRGSAQPHVYPSHINGMTLSLPSSDVIRMFCKVVAPLFEQCSVAEKAIAKAQEARNRLLPKLMSGEITL